MLEELGMLPDLKEDYLLRVAKDIEVSASGRNQMLDNSQGTKKNSVGGNNLNINNDSKGSGSDSFRLARSRGKRLLRYLKQSENCSDLFKSRMCQKLSIISFIPARKPVSIELGGHILYESTLTSFKELLAISAGPLGFSVMPVLDEDLAPPLIFFSALGVTTSPPIEVVLRHLRNLTVNSGDSLDRWNHEKFSIRETFSTLFQHLYDQWKHIVPPVQDAIKCSQIIPVGHFLVRPARLFFRLQGDDLSPFMHEVPRYFGAHEQFLKILGVKEEPSASDNIEVVCTN